MCALEPGAGARNQLLRSFHYLEVGDVLAELAAAFELQVEEGGRGLAGEAVEGGGRVRVHLPLVVPGLPEGEPMDTILDAVTAPLGLQLLVLVQAGASGLGLWHQADLVAHKIIKKYVVRGRGKAQSTHLSTRGKSRYGSRLRLQNARRQLEETAAKVGEWRAAHGAFERVFLSCPRRLLGEYREALGPHLAGAGDPVRIPLDVHVPGSKELLRVRRFLERGRVERVDAPI